VARASFAASSSVMLYPRRAVRPAVAPGARVTAEVAAAARPPTEAPLLAERRHGAARLCIWRHA
jgi:hypothetical protein